MTYRKTKKCGLMCEISRFIRKIRWTSAKHKLSWHVSSCSYQAIRTHFSANKY